MPPDALELGRVSGAYGLKGWIKVQPASTDSVLPRIKTWWIEQPPGTWNPHQVAGARLHGGGVVAQLQGFDDRTPAEGLKGARVWARRADFPAPPRGEFYWADLIGCTVLDPDGASLGTVTGLQDHGAHPILEVQPLDSARENLLIPFVEDIVLSVDATARSLRTSWRADYLD